MEVLAKLLGGHEVEPDGAEDTLPAAMNLLEPVRWDEPLERINKSGLLAVNRMMYGSHNPMNSMEL